MEDGGRGDDDEIGSEVNVYYCIIYIKITRVITGVNGEAGRRVPDLNFIGHP